MSQYVHFVRRGVIAECGVSASDEICYPTLRHVSCTLCIRAATDALRQLTALERAVQYACDHDIDCEEEGEGECCYRKWRTVHLLVGATQHVSDEDRALLDAALHPQEASDE